MEDAGRTTGPCGPMEMKSMTIAYVDCFSGASGDMFLGALFHLGYTPEQLHRDLASLRVPGYKVSQQTRVVSGITSVKAIVETEETHVHRNLADILQLIEESKLSDRIKIQGVKLFTRLAEAEARVHNTTVDEIHFHEVGAVDSIVDILGTLCGFAYLGIEEMYCGSIPLGTGFVECQHGRIPVPAPATLELLKGYPVYQTDVEAELVTPTGALLLTSLCQFVPPPAMRLLRVGYGAGSKVLATPNLLRISLGEKVESQERKLPPGGSPIAIIEASIDDMNPEFYSYVIEKLQAAGALEVTLTAVQGKKGRPATLLTVLANPARVELLQGIIFRETTTLGVRVRNETMYGLTAERLQVELGDQRIGVKIARMGQQVTNIAPEYEDCKMAADQLALPLKDVYDLAKELARKQITQ